MKGNIVYSENDNRLSATKLNLQDLPLGVYIIKITNNANNITIELKTLIN